MKIKRFQLINSSRQNKNKIKNKKFAFLCLSRVESLNHLNYTCIYTNTLRTNTRCVYFEVKLRKNGEMKLIPTLRRNYTSKVKGKRFYSRREQSLTRLEILRLSETDIYT